MFCKYCGKELPDGAKFCARCGKNQRDISSKNEKAKSDSKTDSKLVSKIQEPILANRLPSMLPPEKKKEYIPIESSKSRLIMSLLAFFFGDIGAHRFYAGKPFSAFIQLILGLSFLVSLILLLFAELEVAAFLCIVGIVWSFWVLIDFILILCGSFKDKDGLPITDWGL